MKVGVIADDLTGANATGVKLVEQGLDVYTQLNYSTSIPPDSEVSLCINTDSRYISIQDAKQRVYSALQMLQDHQVDVICKRIDSTFRGNIGQELDTLLDELGEETVAIIVPSYPSSKRIVAGGFLLVNGTPLQETDISNDPVKPINISYLPEILKKQTDKSIALVNLDRVILGRTSIETEINRYINEGHRLIMLDAISEQHIESIAKAMKNITERKLIPVDPGPLTNHYIKSTDNPNQKDMKTLVSVGSASSLTTKQIQFLVKKLNITPIYIKPEKLVTSDGSLEDEINRVIFKALEIMEDDQVIVLTTNHPNAKLVDFYKLSEEEGISKELLAKRISSGLAQISKEVIENSEGKIQACFFSGGDTTTSFCEAIQSTGMNLVSEVMPLAAYGTLVGGDLQGLSIVTKGGMVGEEDAIYRSVIYLQKNSLKNRRLLLNG